MTANPNGANQHTSDPREQIMWDIYVAKLSKGIDNAMQSAIEAGYAEDTAKNITLTGWYKERKSKLKRKEMLSKAERNLDKVLDMNYEYIDEKGQEKTNTDILKVVVDVSKTVAHSLGKDEGYSTRTEQTGKNGEAIEVKQITGMKIIQDADIGNTIQEQES